MIHALALVENSTIGEGTRVWQFASVIRGATLGKDCNVGAYALIDGATAGDNCLIGSNAQLHPGIEIGNSVFIGPGVIFCNDMWPRVGKDGFDTEVLLNGIITTTRVSDNANIGAGAVVLPGIVIGTGAMIAAGAIVHRNVPDGHIFWRNRSVSKLVPGQGSNRMRECCM